jgi:lipopolysaccharide/colanic/teichoic acid biosynthesis glycosyltransferase
MQQSRESVDDELTWGCVLERIAAFAILVLVSPVILLSAVMTKITSRRGPMFYRQIRIGRDRRIRSDALPHLQEERRVTPGAGQPFLIWKLRTMIPEAESKTGPVWATDQDPRITPLGRFFRKTRIDELPQLLNVMAGEMSLIGPRPERQFFIDQLSLKIPEYRQRLSVAPGITGLAQINRAYDSDENDVRKKVQYDMFYIRNRSLRMNLLILAKTLDVVIHRRGSH